MPLQVFISKPPAESSEETLKRTVYVTGLVSKHFTESSIRDIILKATKLGGEEVEEVRMPRDARTGKPKGFCYLQMKDITSFQTLLAFKSIEVDKENVMKFEEMKGKQD